MEETWSELLNTYPSPVYFQNSSHSDPSKTSVRTWQPSAQNSESESVSHSVVSTLCNPMDCSPPGSSVHAFQLNEARILSELPFPSPGDPLNPGIRPRSSILLMDYLPSEPPCLLIPLGLRTKSLQQPTRSCMILETPLLTSSSSVLTIFSLFQSH